MSLLSDKDGKKLLKAARDSVLSHFNHKSFKLTGFPEKLGVFVTIHSYPSHDLRGCIGFPEPVFPLNEGLPKSAVAAAFQDPRFPPLEKDELNKVIFEISILTKPELVKVNNFSEYPKKINLGKDGLIVYNGFNHGLLLPIVAEEYGWDCETFLCQTCNKAGLPRDAWKEKNCKIYKFQAQVFSEEKPSK